MKDGAGRNLVAASNRRGVGPAVFVAFLIVGLVLSSGLQAPCAAQGAARGRVLVGAGAMAPGREGARWGAHAFLGYAGPLSSRVDYRIAGFVGRADVFGQGRATAAGADVSVLLDPLTGSVGPYAGLGLAATHTEISADVPLRSDLGVLFQVGFRLSRPGRTWFVEAAPRVFGNVFNDVGSTVTMWVLTVGLLK